jgi:hypothetical protein
MGIRAMTKRAVFLFFILASIKLSGQSAGYLGSVYPASYENINISSLSRLQKNYLEKIYFESVTAPNELINGKEYLPYYYRSGTNPLLFVNMNRKATLLIRDMQFKNLTLQYDTYLDDVIYSDFSKMVNGGFPQIALNRDIVKGFNLYFDYDSLIFRYFSFPAKYADRMNDGFYEVAYDGKTQFLIKHRSTIYNKEGLDKYAYSPEKYIFSGDAWVKITSKKSFLKIFGEREKEINGVVHKLKVKVPGATKSQIAEILKYYDSPANSAK